MLAKVRDFRFRIVFIFLVFLEGCVRFGRLFGAKRVNDRQSVGWLEDEDLGDFAVAS